jgi:hypothetical protein
MTVKIVFSTGKEIELTEEELRELYGQSQQIVVNPIQIQPFTYPPTYPYYPGYPVITCDTNSNCGTCSNLNR